MTMTLIETKTVSTAVATVEFVSIPQDGTDLVILISCRANAGGGGLADIQVKLNGATTGYSDRFLSGTLGAVESGTRTNAHITLVGMANGSGSTSNTFGNSTMYIPNYSGATNKSVSSDGTGENNSTDSRQTIEASLFSNTAAITSVSFALDSGGLQNFAVGSVISLYKITKGSDGIVTTS